MTLDKLWAPWRIEYLKSIDTGESESGCFLCDYWSSPERDAENLVLWRTKVAMLMFNRFPYTAGHLMVVPGAHVARPQDLSNETLTDLMIMANDAQTILAETIRAQGFNVGINVGRCAGAGVPDHVHLHIVPRWEGDTNFMTTCGDTRVISQALEQLYQQLLETVRRLGLPQR